MRRAEERRQWQREGQDRALLSAWLRRPTCNLEGDGEERGDTRLLLSLGLTRCNYRGDSAISYAHTLGRRRHYQANTECNRKNTRDSQRLMQQQERPQRAGPRITGLFAINCFKNMIKSVFYYLWSERQWKFCLCITYFEPRFTIKGHIHFWWPCHAIRLEILVFAIKINQITVFSTLEQQTRCCS